MPNTTRVRGVEAHWYRCPDCLNFYYSTHSPSVLLRFANDRRNYVLDFDTVRSGPPAAGTFEAPRRYDDVGASHQVNDTINA